MIIMIIIIVMTVQIVYIVDELYCSGTEFDIIFKPLGNCIMFEIKYNCVMFELIGQPYFNLKRNNRQNV